MELIIKRNTEWAKKFKEKTEFYNKGEWLQKDTTLKDFILGKDIAGVGQSYFPSSYHKAIFEYIRNQKKLIDSIKALQDVSDIKPLEEFQKGVINAGGGRKCMLAVHAMLCALNPTLLCNVVDEKRLNDLYSKLIAKKEEENNEETSDNSHPNISPTKSGIILKDGTNTMIIELSNLGNEDFWGENNDTSWYKKSHAMKTFFKDCYSDLPWATLMAIEGDERAKSLSERLLLQKNMILTGAPGTGKTYLAQKIAETIISKNKNKKTTKQIDFVQFHPSYDYSDFVEGLRPIMDGNSVAFRRMDGKFKSFCNTAAKDKGNNYVFIIDEINRGEISKIFGELFFAIDPGYRGGGKNKTYVKTQYHQIIENKMDDESKADDYCFKEGFYVPDNVYIIGTMNDIDRSVDSMDFAFRRRFAFIEITASESESMIYNSNLKDSFYSYSKDNLLSRMDSLNKAIIDPQKGGLSSEYQIGGAYFLKIDKVKYSYKRLWDEYIKGVLIEYYRGNPEQERILKQLEEAYNCTPDSEQ